MKFLIGMVKMVLKEQLPVHLDEVVPLPILFMVILVKHSVLSLVRMTRLVVSWVEMFLIHQREWK